MPAHASRHGLLPFGNPALMTSHETFREPEARVAAAARETVPATGRVG